jgi:dihydroxyacetone kinase-like protein
MLTPNDLQSGLLRWSDAMQKASAELNALDAQLGDGDLGTTLDKCAANVRIALDAPHKNFPEIFEACATACAKASGSSFGTLLAVAFLTASKSTSEAAAIDRSELARLLHEITAALSARGGASLGDKTMLDSIEAISIALSLHKVEHNLRGVAADAASGALDAFRQKPNKVGRARMFADKSMGMDDPGMVAILRMAQSL